MSYFNEIAAIIAHLPKSAPAKTIASDLTANTNALEDIRNLIAGIAAFVAVLFGTITVYQKLRDKKIALRKQLTDILQNILDKNLKIEEFRLQKDGKGNMPYNYTGLMYDYTRMYVEHAHEIVAQIRRQVSSHELTILAWAFNSIDDIARAEKYFQLAVKTAKSDLEGILSKRNYARFVHATISATDGNKKFDQLLQDCPAEDDRMIYYRAETYIRWAKLYELSNRMEFERLVNKAITELKEMKNKMRMERTINDFKLLLGKPDNTVKKVVHKYLCSNSPIQSFYYRKFRPLSR